MSLTPFSWVRVVRACPAVTDAEFRVWFADCGLNNSAEGSWASNEAIGAATGKDAHTVAVLRSRMKAFGLYRTVPRPEGKNALGWIPDLPEHCRPSLRPTNREVELLVTELSAHVNTHRGATQRSRGDPQPGLSASSTGVDGSDNGDCRSRQSPLMGGGKRGEGASSALPARQSTPTSTTPVGYREAEDGGGGRVRVREREEGGPRRVDARPVAEILEDLRRAAEAD